LGLKHFQEGGRTPITPRRVPAATPERIMVSSKLSVKTPIEKGNERPSRNRTLRKIESVAAMKPVNTASCDKLKNIENLENPIA
jgi:hypothetical protein